ncbi:MAG: hypothetical protein QXR26_06700 [Candidatus Caldarchaeum sp.]
MDNDITMAEGGEETTESIRKQAYEPPGREVRRFYADIHRMANKNRKRKSGEQYHVYTDDGEAFYRVSRFSEIPAEHGDELYVDTIPVELTDEFVELLFRGVKVYYLRRLTLFKEMYTKLGIGIKNAENDIRVMMSLEAKWFRQVNEEFLIMRRLIAAYRSLLKSHQSLMKRMKALNGSEKDILKNAVKALEEQMTIMAQMIVDEAGKRIPAYSRVVDTLKVGGYSAAKVALAEVMTYADFSKGITKLKNYFGPFKVDGRKKGKRKIFSGEARKALEMLTMALKGTAMITAKNQLQTIEKIRETLSGERLEVIPA